MLYRIKIFTHHMVSWYPKEIKKFNAFRPIRFLMVLGRKYGATAITSIIYSIGIWVLHLHIKA